MVAAFSFKRLFTVFFDLTYIPSQIVFGCYIFGSGLVMLPTLFLALDRSLIVALPHKFQLHERKMFLVKLFIGIYTSLVSFGVGATLAQVSWLIGLSSLNVMLQFLACLVLYTIIVVRILVSDRQMSSNRHNGNG